MGLKVFVGEEGIMVGKALGQAHEIMVDQPSFRVAVALDVAWSWSRIETVEAIDPWPGFRITSVPIPGLPHRPVQDFHPLRVHLMFSFTPDDEDLRGFERLTEQLLWHTSVRAPNAVRRGWLDVPDEPWEPVLELPSGETVEHAGAYRSTGDRIVARRSRPGVFETLLTWLASSPEKPWRATTREVAMDFDHLYVEHWDGSRWRVPLSTLRARLASEYDDVVWVFARRNFLILPARESCPVTERLARRLSARR
jgi:hypothetical protein